jgi:riboflavin biosynthesis pyrimidine reductase
VTRRDLAKIAWRPDRETRYPYGPVSPDPEGFEPLGFPPPWPTRPWIYANVIASKNGILTWTRTGATDDPVGAVAGGDVTRSGRFADLRLMRYLRACADAVSVGAQTLRDQPDLVGTFEDVGGGLGEALRRWRASHSRPRVPLQVVYSQSGRLDLAVPMFNTPELTAIVVTAEPGARRLRAGGSDDRRLTIIVAGEERVGPTELVRAHERLSEEFGVRYLDCEGGAVTLDSLRRAGIMDEVFVTVTDVHIDASAHAGVKRVFSFEKEGARLIAEGRVASDAGYVFRRWRFNER